MMKRFRNTMLAGLIALLPLYLTFALLIWLFQTADAFFQPWLARAFHVSIWGLGILATALVIFVTGVIVSSVSGGLVLDWIDRVLERVPILKGLYRGIKQIVESFNPNNPSGFKEFVLVKNPSGTGYDGGFLTGDFTLIQPNGMRRELAVVFIPSNHLYLGAVRIVDRARIVKTTMTLQDGVTFALSAGASAKGDIQELGNSTRRLEKG
ncbi:MAG: DUF502 domain-containing protein [Nitrospiria bacterium]